MQRLGQADGVLEVINETRWPQRPAALNTFTVWVDRQLAGLAFLEDSFVSALTAGEHHVRVTRRWYGSYEIAVNIAPRERTVLVATTLPLTSIWSFTTTLFRPRRAIALLHADR